MNAIYEQIALPRVPRSVQDLSGEKKLSLNMGELIPVMCEEVVPGDKFKVQSEIMIRLAPMLAPVMHRIHVYTHSFYVPNRLVWDNWHDHITGGEDGTANPAFPYIPINGTSRDRFGVGSLADYLGVPVVDPAVTITEGTQISALPFRGYQLIYNEYFRDQDLSAKVNLQTGDGDQLNWLDEHLNLRKRHWQKDYFTAARPSSQKGAEVQLPFDVNYKFPSQIVDSSGNPIDATTGPDGSIGSRTSTGLVGIELNGTATPDYETQVAIDNIEDLGLGIRELRASNKLQEWLELAQRGGSRINEVIRNFFGVRPDDLRLNRPQFLGSSRQNVVLSEVLNTAGDTGSTLQPLGEYGGHGVSVGNQAGFTGTFKEHGYVFMLMSVLPVTGYSQGLARHWTKFDKYDRYWPQFQNLGEQEVLNQEIYMDYSATEEQRKGIFGYNPMYSEYKVCANGSSVHGDFRKIGTADNLSYWHMNRHFETPPALNETFVTADPTQRIFASTDPDVDKLYCQIYHSVKAVRPMAKFSMPSLV